MPWGLAGALDNLGSLARELFPVSAQRVVLTPQEQDQPMITSFTSKMCTQGISESLRPPKMQARAEVAHAGCIPEVDLESRKFLGPSRLHG